MFEKKNKKTTITKCIHKTRVPVREDNTEFENRYLRMNLCIGLKGAFRGTENFYLPKH